MIYGQDEITNYLLCRLLGKCVDSLQRRMAGSYCRSDSGINEVYGWQLL